MTGQPVPAVPDLVVVGNLIIDDLVFDDGTTRMEEPGGAVLYTALGARLWNLTVGIVSLAGDDYPRAPFDRLRARGIDLGGVRQLDGPGLRAWLLYEPKGRRLVHRLERPGHDEASPRASDIPALWRTARAIHLTPAPLTAQSALVDALSTPDGPQLSLDPHTPVQPSLLEAWATTLAGVDVFFVSDEELQLARPSHEDEARALATVMAPLWKGRLQEVAIKQGRRGGVLLSHGVPPVAWQARSAAVVDPTGAGDAFAGGYLAGRLQDLSPARALAQGVVAASFAMEAWGAAGLFAALPAHAHERLRQWFPETTIPG